MAGATRIHRKSVALGSEFPLTTEEHHHLTRVLRMTTGGEVAVIDESTGRRFIGICTGEESGQISVIREEESDGVVQSWVYVVAFALCKGDHNDLVVEKCTELGVSRVVLFEACRSIVRFGDKRESKTERFERIARGAALQCGRAAPPEIALTASLEEAFAHMNGTPLRFVASLESTSRPLPDVLFTKNEASITGEPCGIIIGPEGDLTREEYEQCRANSVIPISLGPLILRAETAAIALVAAINGAWGFKSKP